MKMLYFINIIAAVAITILLSLALFASIIEREKRAFWLTLFSIIGNLIFWILLIRFLDISAIRLFNLAIFAGIGFFILISSLRFFPAASEMDSSEIERYDERNHMFSRNFLKQYPELSEQYYRLHPENLSHDQRMHQRPELGEPGHTFYDPLYSPVFNSAFLYLERTKNTAEGSVSPEKKTVDAASITRLLRSLGLFYGAADIGFTTLSPHHFYSHYGRNAEKYGEEIKIRHSHAIVIIVAMDNRMVHESPTLPVIIESARQYVESAKIAHIIAHYIRDLGYNARAHVDQNYEVLCVPLAADAGLGEVGRMGLLMHPRLGPCLRISVVTTDLPLRVDKKKNFHIDHFCGICKKCAQNCPAQAIPHDEKPVSRGIPHWSIQQEKCHLYWKTVGSDCAFCIRVCPYSKPDNLFHRLIRWYVSRNALNQRLALFFDDLFYSRKPKVPQQNPRRFFIN